MHDIQDRAEKATKITWIGFAVNSVLMLFKLFAGIIGKSEAMIADGIHSLSDLGTDVIVLFGFRFVGKPPDESHDYGHGKFETLTATIVGIILIGVGAGIMWNGGKSIYDFFNGTPIERPGWIAFYAAIISIISKEILYRYTISVGKKINSQAIIANAWHQRSDSLSSVGAMLGIGGAIMLGDRWHILDPAAAIVVSILILKVGIEIVIKGLKELLETSLDKEAENKIVQITENVLGVESSHKLKTRRVGNNIAIDIHIEVREDLNIKDAHNIATAVENKLRGAFGEGTHISVHIEPEKS
ncbi:MAG: cation transporter [Candidatus Schekmanbacteria bacterium]|nr:MAG: cation transporter [Candidatus Schekmanbacteria bacterium]